MTLPPRCPYCSNAAVLADGATIYPGRIDLKDLKFWWCEPCDAYVGCHKPNKGYGDGTRPLGTLANGELRKYRMKVHLEFDALWNTKEERKAAYKWLAAELQIPPDKCHIAMFDAAQCEKVYFILSRKYDNLLKGTP